MAQIQLYAYKYETFGNIIFSMLSFVNSCNNTPNFITALGEQIIYNNIETIIIYDLNVTISMTLN